MRVPPAQFQQKAFRVHSFLADVPLHDVWALQLRGGGQGRSVRDVLQLFFDGSLQSSNPLVRALFGLRSILGRLFRWDQEAHDGSARSYAHRLTDADRAQSLEEPGTRHGPFCMLYTFEHEALGEVINRTVHAFLSFAMEPAEDGYTVYWAIYVKPVSWLTQFYMALIDPFRRLLVYPAIIKHIEQTWSRRWHRPPQGDSSR